MGELFVNKVTVHPSGAPAYAIYMAHLEDGAIADAIPSHPFDDAPVLARVAAKWKGSKLTCALDLATVGAPLGFMPRETPLAAAQYKAAGVVRILGHHYADVSYETAIDLLQAGVTFLESGPWKRSSTSKRYAAKGVLTNEDGTKATVPLILRITETADGPGIELCDQGLFEAMICGERTPRRWMRLSVTLANGPPFAASAVKDGFGHAFVVRITHVLDGCVGPPGDLEALFLTAALRAVSGAPGLTTETGEARLGECVVRVEADRRKTVPLVSPPKGSELADREFARVMAQTLCSASPPDPSENLTCVVLDVRTGLGLELSNLLDSAGAGRTRDTETAKTRLGKEAQHRGLWLPTDLIAREFEPYIGPDNAARLGERLPPNAVRVLLVVGNTSLVFEVDIEPGEAHRVKSELDELHEAEALLPELKRDLKRANAPSPAPPVEGTWRDGRNHLPKELPESWTVRAFDERGVVTVDVGDGLSFQLGVVRREGRRGVNVLVMREDASKPTREQVERVLPHLRGCKPFGEMAMFRGERAMPMPGARVFSARLTGDGVS